MKIMDLPDGVSGDWELYTLDVTDSYSRTSKLRALMNNGRGYVPPGKLKILKREDVVVMSNTQDEMLDHKYFIAKATGNVLIMGLGIGMALCEILKKDEVKSVTVIERSRDVINLVAGFYEKDPRVCILQGDALVWKPEKGVRYDVVWHDIWDTIDEENLPDMIKLHRRFGRYSSWQGSWCRKECERKRKELREWEVGERMFA